MTPEQWTALIAALAALFTAVGGLIGAVAVLYSRVEANHSAINGRLSELIETTRAAGHAEGVLIAQQLRGDIPPVLVPGSGADPAKPRAE